MSIRDILKQYPYIADDAQDMQREIKRYMELQEDLRQRSVQAQKLSGMPGGSGVGDPVYERIVILIDDYQVNIDRCIERLKELDKRKKWLDKAFAELTEDERRLLYMKYNKNMAYRKMAYVLRKDRNIIPKLVSDAEEKVERIVS